MKKQVIETVFDGKQLFYVKFGYKWWQESEPQLRLWIDKSFLTEEDNKWFVNFPITNCDVITLDNEKDLVVKPGDLNLFYFFVAAGDGSDGKSVIESIDTEQPYQIFKFTSEYEDGSTSTGALIFTKANKVKIRWHRDGILKNDQIAEGTTLLYADGRIETIPNDEVLKYF
jgi:hypothetical protein